jgi:hypothetical protein
MNVLIPDLANGSRLTDNQIEIPAMSIIEVRAKKNLTKLN